MANVQRYRSGNEQVASGKIQASKVVEIGDLVGQTGGYIVPASDSSDSGTGTFHDIFMGVLIHGATSGGEVDDTDALVGFGAVYEYDCAALPTDLPAGTPFGPADGGSTLADQSVAPTTSGEAIGKLARYARQGDTKVQLFIRSVVCEQTYP